MKKSYDFQHTCPSNSDYEMYLQHLGEPEFTRAFKNHLENCALCQEAILGFQSMNISAISQPLEPLAKKFLPRTVNHRKMVLRLTGYAASVIVIIGMASVFLFQQHKTSLYNPDIALDYMPYTEFTPTQHKTMSQKSSEQFIYIASCNRIAYNDQFISTEELQDNLKKQKNLSLITIEVATENKECAMEIISTIKNSQIAPVITF